MTNPNRYRFFVRLLDIPLSFIFALLLYYLFAYLMIDRFQVMPVRRGRMVEIKKFLDSYGSDKAEKEIFILGSSTSIEGLDCNVIDKLLTEGYESSNLAWTGGSLRQWILVLPLIKTASPSLTVLCVDFGSLFMESLIPSELLNIASWWDFFSDDELDYFSNVLEKEEISLLCAPKYKTLWEMRSFLPEAFDSFVRETSRSDLRYDGYISNFKSPWARTKVVSSAAMAKSIENRRESMSRLNAKDFKHGTEVLDTVVRYLTKDGGKVLIVLPPIHPEVFEVLDKDTELLVINMLSELAKNPLVDFVEHSNLSGSEDFTDSVHLFKSGRVRWSTSLGEYITNRLFLTE